MGLTRKMLKAMGIEEEKIEQIIEAHVEVVDGLKEIAASDKEKAEKYEATQRELDNLKAAGNGGWEEKYNKIKGEFDKYKNDIEAKETQSAKEKAYADILKDAGLSDKGIEKALKYADWSKVDLAEDGKVANAVDHIKAVKEEWAEYVTTTTTTGAPTANPPTNQSGGVDLGSLSMADYIAARKNK